MKNLGLLIWLLTATMGLSQTSERNSRDISVSPFIDGTIMVPNPNEPSPLAIIIAGSGPTDRNGNQSMAKNNSLKFLAEGLYDKGIATFRYDKRILKQLKEKTLDEASISFNDFIKDAEDVISYFNRSNAFSKIYIIGHSQGSLVGMVAAQSKVDGFISLAGAGQEIDDVIVDQIERNSPGLKESARKGFDDLRANGIALDYSPYLASIFRQEIQPFLISWMKYDPKEEIAKLRIPVLIINGDKDFQVSVSEAELLKEAQPNAQYTIIPNMNHILKEVGDDYIENSKTYNNPSLPNMKEVTEVISAFILK
ncbi:MAG: alpha/beta hydrolase [Flavobacteriaceae bacterium]|nr:alpha/beta hydrolase [Flavobacteriaceae bacterium]|tara:strand:+ start:47250 stop:48179 length:930 start_codon:yes stop_codon:yes gene_type:complete